MSPKVEMIASICSASTRSSGRWSLISEYVRKPRSLPSLMRFFSRLRRVSASSFGIAAATAALALDLDLGDLRFEELERLLRALDRRLGARLRAFCVRLAGERLG